MPNHVITVIHVADGGATPISEIRAAMLNADGEVDFNVIMPEPDCLDGFEPHMGIIEVANALKGVPLNGHPMVAALEIENRRDAMKKWDAGEMKAEDVTAVERALANFDECGYMYWHDWRSANWGTKWNAYDQSVNPPHATTFTFQTAWSHPTDMMEQICLRLPNVTFEVTYADEDLGSNVGKYTCKGDEILKEDIAPKYDEQTPEDHKHFTEMAWNLHWEGVDPRTHGYDENWEFSEEIEEKYGDWS